VWEYNYFICIDFFNVHVEYKDLSTLCLIALYGEHAQYSSPWMDKYYRKKWICWKCVACKIGFVYFSFRPIAPKQFNSLTTIDSLSGLGDAEVTHPLWVQEVPGSIPGSAQGFYFWSFCFDVVVFYLLSKNTDLVSLNELLHAPSDWWRHCNRDFWKVWLCLKENQFLT